MYSLAPIILHDFKNQPKTSLLDEIFSYPIKEVVSVGVWLWRSHEQNGVKAGHSHAVRDHDSL
jgi:hypothetical protein